MTDQIFMPDRPPLALPTRHVDGPVFHQRGPLTVRLAKSKHDIDAAQALRYQVFYEEMSAKADAETLASQRDADAFDGFCEHLLLTTSAPTEDVCAAAQLKNGETLIGCYRLLRDTVAQKYGGFYSANEFDLAPMLNGVGRGLSFMELGRSCVAPAYRNKLAVDMLWHGLGQMVSYYAIDALFGCASFEGTAPEALALPLSHLYHTRRTQGPWQVRAHEALFVDMNMLPEAEIDPRRALRAMPPVLRGYVRSGCMIGDGAIVDSQFGTVDVFVLMPLMAMEERYMARYGKVDTGGLNG